MKKIFVLIILSLFAFDSDAQISFFKLFSNSGYDFGQGVVQLADSSYAICGSSSSFEDAPADIFLLKIDKQGNYVWSNHFGGDESDIGVRVVNFDSSYYVAGYSNSAQDQYYNFMLEKIDKNGYEVFQKHIIYPGWEKLNDALLSTDTMLYMVGSTTATENGENNFFVVKTNLDGDTIWTINTGFDGSDELFSIQQLNDSVFYAAGNAFIQDSSVMKAAVMKFKSDGTVYWIKYFGDNGAYSLSDFYINGSMIYGVGYRIYPELLDLDEYRLTISTSGIFLSEGSDHSDGDVVYDQVCQYGNLASVYIASHYQNAYSSGGSVDVGITRFYSNLIWSPVYTNIGFPDAEYNRQIIPTSDSGAIAVGYTYLDGLGGSGVYVLKIGPGDNFPTVSQNNINDLLNVEQIDDINVSIYPNPATDFVQISTPETVEMAVYSLTGQLQLNEEVVNQTKLSIENWKSGVYILKLKFQNGYVKSYRLIVR